MNDKIKEIKERIEKLKRDTTVILPSMYIRDSEYLLSIIKSLQEERDRYREALNEIVEIYVQSHEDARDMKFIAQQALKEE